MADKLIKVRLSTDVDHYVNPKHIIQIESIADETWEVTFTYGKTIKISQAGLDALTK